MRQLGIVISGDYNSGAIKEATAGVEQFGRTVNEAATKNVERLSAQRVKLQELAGEYRALAASADKGSAQQVAAADLAAKAEKRLGLEVLATNSAVRTSARETALATTETAKLSRGALEATGSFGKFGAALALGSGGFIVGAGLTMGLKSILTATKAEADAREQLNVALKNRDLSVGANTPGIDAYLKSESKLAVYTKGELLGSMTQLIRTTGNVSKAETDMSLAANLARGSHNNLASATQMLIAIEAGRFRGVQQYGLELPKIKTAEDALAATGDKYTAAQKRKAVAMDLEATKVALIAEAYKRYGNAAETYSEGATSATDRLHVSVNTLETSMGTVLLPAVNELIAPFAAWTQKEADSGKAAKVTKEAIGDLTTVLHDAKTIVEGFDKVTGGFVNTLELLIGLKMASKLSGWVGGFQATAAAEGVAIGRTEALKLALLSLPTTIGIAVSLVVVEKIIKDFLTQNGGIGSTPIAGQTGGSSAGSGIQISVGKDGQHYAKIGGVYRPISAHQAAIDTAKFGGRIDNAGGAAAQARAGLDSPNRAGGFTNNPVVHHVVVKPTPTPDLFAGLGNLAGSGTPGASKHAKALAIISGSALLGSLADKIAADANSAKDSQGSAAEVWLKREKDDLEKARTELAKKLAAAKADGASAKQIAAIKAEATHIDSQIASVNKGITDNLKAQAAAIKASAATAIAADKQAITSAFSNIITDAQTAFSAATQAYITNTLGPKYFQGLLSPKEQQLADMQAADTAKSLADGLTAAQKQLADDMNGSLVEHVVDVATGSAKNIFGPKGSPDQVSLDQQAVAQAQRMIDENSLSIDATVERKDADKAYAEAVTQYQQQRADAEHAMTNSLNELVKGIENGTASIGDLPGVLAKYGLTAGAIELSSAGGFSDDMTTLRGAVTDLAKAMIDEALALRKLGDPGAANTIGETASLAAIANASAIPVTNVTSSSSASERATAIDNANQAASDVALAMKWVLAGGTIPHMASGGDILRDGLIYAHAGERVQPAEVVRGSGGGMTFAPTFSFPNYVGSHAELAQALTHPSVLEAVGTSVAMSSRRGHLKQSDIRS